MTRGTEEKQKEQKQKPRQKQQQEIKTTQPVIPEKKEKKEPKLPESLTRAFEEALRRAAPQIKQQLTKQPPTEEKLPTQKLEDARKEAKKLLEYLNRAKGPADLDRAWA